MTLDDERAIQWLQRKTAPLPLGYTAEQEETRQNAVVLIALLHSLMGGKASEPEAAPHT